MAILDRNFSPLPPSMGRLKGAYWPRKTAAITSCSWNLFFWGFEILMAHVLRSTKALCGQKLHPFFCSYRWREKTVNNSKNPVSQNMKTCLRNACSLKTPYLSRQRSLKNHAVVLKLTKKHKLETVNTKFRKKVGSVIFQLQKSFQFSIQIQSPELL